MVSEILLPINEDEEPLEDVLEDELPDEEVVEEEAPDELAVLRSEVERLKGLEGVAADLRRSVGRIQSLENRSQQDTTNNEELVAEISKQFGGVHELLSTVVEGIDETALDPTTKARVRQAYETSRRANEANSLRKEAAAEALAILKRDRPQLFEADTQDDGSNPEHVVRAQRIEATVVPLFEDQNLDPDDPQFAKLWTEGAALIQSGKTDREIRAYFRDSIADNNAEDAAATRRQTAKDRAGKGSPTPAGTPDDGPLYTGDLDKDMARMREMGINV